MADYHNQDTTHRIHVHWSPSTTSKHHFTVSTLHPPGSPALYLPDARYNRQSSVDPCDYDNRRFLVWNVLKHRFRHSKKSKESSPVSSLRSSRSSARSSARRTTDRSSGSVASVPVNHKKRVSQESQATQSSSSRSSSVVESRAAAWVFPNLHGPLTPGIELVDSLDVTRTRSSEVDSHEQPHKHGNKQKSSKREQEDELLQFVNLALVTCCCPCVAISMPFICPKDYERAVVFRLGKLRSGGAKGPGVTFFNHFIDENIIVDMRIETADISPQKILTLDGVHVVVDGVALFRVVDAVSSYCDVADHREATAHMCESTLRSVLGKHTLSAVLERKASILEGFHKLLAESTTKWGVVVVALDIKNIHLPEDMRRTMSKEAESEKLALAKVEQAKGEENAAFYFATASKNLSDPTAVSLRSLKELCNIASKSPATVLFPFVCPEGFWDW